MFDFFTVAVGMREIELRLWSISDVLRIPSDFIGS